MKTWRDYGVSYVGFNSLLFYLDDVVVPTLFAGDLIQGHSINAVGHLTARSMRESNNGIYDDRSFCDAVSNIYYAFAYTLSRHVELNHWLWDDNTRGADSQESALSTIASAHSDHDRAAERLCDFYAVYYNIVSLMQRVIKEFNHSTFYIGGYELVADIADKKGDGDVFIIDPSLEAMTSLIRGAFGEHGTLGDTLSEQQVRSITQYTREHKRQRLHTITTDVTAVEPALSDAGATLMGYVHAALQPEPITQEEDKTHSHEALAEPDHTEQPEHDSQVDCEQPATSPAPTPVSQSTSLPSPSQRPSRTKAKKSSARKSKPQRLKSVDPGELSTLKGFEVDTTGGHIVPTTKDFDFRLGDIAATKYQSYVRDTLGAEAEHVRISVRDVHAYFAQWLVDVLEFGFSDRGVYVTISRGTAINVAMMAALGIDGKNADSKGFELSPLMATAIDIVNDYAGTTSDQRIDAMTDDMQALKNRIEQLSRMVADSVRYTEVSARTSSALLGERSGFMRIPVIKDAEDFDITDTTSDAVFLRGVKCVDDRIARDTGMTARSRG